MAERFSSDSEQGALIHKGSKDAREVELRYNIGAEEKRAQNECSGGAPDMGQW